MPTRLAAVVVARDEQAHLERLFSQLTQVFDQVVVVLDELESPTVGDGWCRECGVEVLRRPQSEDLGALWTAGFSLASADFLFWAHSDEIVVTEAPDMASAGAQIRGVLSSNRHDGFYARIWSEKRVDYWFQPNWFRRARGVQVRQFAQCRFMTPGSMGYFPPGLLDRVQAPLTPPPLRKKWRQFDRHLEYLRRVDAHDPGTLYQLARSFNGPAPAEITLWLDFVELALPGGRGEFVQVWAALNRLIELSEKEEIPSLPGLAAKMVQVYQDELLAHLLEGHLACLRSPSLATGRRLRELMRRRNQFKHSRGAETVGWYDGKELYLVASDLSRLVDELRLAELADLAREVWEELRNRGGSNITSAIIQKEVDRLERWRVSCALS